jgi:hypothetical protein
VTGDSVVLAAVGLIGDLAQTLGEPFKRVAKSSPHKEYLKALLKHGRSPSTRRREKRPTGGPRSPSKAETAAAVDHARGLRSRQTRTSAEDGVGSDRWPLNQSDCIAGAREGWMARHVRIYRIGEGPAGMYLALRARAWPAGQH